MSVLAELQLANGKTAEGMATMDKVIARADATPVSMHQVARFQQNQGNKDLAIKIFNANAKRFPNQWPVNVGMARAYALQGDLKKAAASARIALKQAPDEPNRKNLQAMITQWEGAQASKQ
jgi:predicted Zn-dependent protease